uniref:ATP:cob(I)alamin adenosyltransferase n=1 Tax=Alicyclobacillus suci TaxID=2816080 RepID=UPI001A8D5E56
DVGRDLATPDDKRDGVYLHQSDVDLLEKIIDALNEEMPPLRQFVLPSGHPVAALLHVSRTVVRRVERQIVTLEKSETLNPVIRKYLN